MIKSAHGCFAKYLEAVKFTLTFLINMSNASLREKFKLLREWQMQQQQEFERIKMEHSKNFKNNGNVSIDKADDAVQISNDNNELVDIENIDQRDGYDADNNHESIPAFGQNLLKRMSSNSLEQALHIAVNELKSQRVLIAEPVVGELQESGESSDGENDGRNYFENDSWNGNVKLQTAIFKENLHRNTANDELCSDGESATDEIIEMDGFYPITYSEDNASHGEVNLSDASAEDNNDYGKQHSEILGKEVSPFDEKPIQSKIGQDAISFEDLIEKQLEAERKSEVKTNTTENHSAPKKKFLRKGEGIARFIGGMRNGQGAKVSYMKGSKGKPLPKASLKLRKEPTLKEGKVMQVATNAGQVPEELSLKRDVGGSKYLVMENSPRQDFPNVQPLSSSVGFQRHKAGTVDSSIEASFQKMLENNNANEKIADEELEEFELLEKVALDTSISSNASSVLRLVSAKRSNFFNHSTSSPIPKAAVANQDIEPEDCVNEILEESDDSMNAIEEDIDKERSVHNKLEKVAIADKVKVFDRNEADKKIEGNEMKEDQFFDYSEWDDTICSSDGLGDGNSTIVESPKLKKPSDASQRQPGESSPPTSQLMKKFFPKLDAKEKILKQSHGTAKKILKPKEDLKFSRKQNLHSVISKENIPPAVHTDILKSKLSELENEISRFKKENTVLETLRVEKEKELANLRNEVQQFQKQRAEELEQIEKFRDEEMQKLRREKKTFEKYQKAVRSAPSKKEREEIESLSQEVIQLKEDIKRRETRWNGSASRFRKRIEDLENENHELKESIKLLEKERLQRWGKVENKSLEVKERNVNRVSSDDVKQAKNEVFIRSDLQKSKKCIDRDLDVNPVARKVNSKPKKSISPRGETGKSKSDGKGEVSPRADATPHEQPEIPREPRSDDTSSRDVTENTKVHLSLTPERKQTPAEKTMHNNAQMKHQDGKVERILPDGSREIIFPNGTRKTIDPTNQHIIVSFFNGDIKQIFPDDRTIYFYAESKTTHTSYKDGTEVFEFSNGQSEKHYPDGRKVITFHDQTVKCIFPNGAEETVFEDGTIQNIDINGQRTISFPNGQREIHTQNFKRREYPDGTVKTVYQDGRQETRYSTGRIRIKDKFGNVTLDTGMS